MLLRRTLWCIVTTLVVCTIVILVLALSQGQIWDMPDMSEVDNRKGYSIEKGNVHFEFINPSNIHGTPEENVKALAKKYRLHVAGYEVSEPKDYDMSKIRPPQDQAQYDRASATIVCLVKNNEIQGMEKTLRSFEASFNSKFGYPYTFMNDEPFSKEFEARIRSLSLAPMAFIQIPPELWDRPSTIDVEKQRKLMKIMADKDVVYADNESYRDMCRFNLVNFYKVPEMENYKWYWRIEPKVDFYTDMQYDAFKYLEATNKVYGFTIAVSDIEQTIETLWVETLHWLNREDNFKFVNKNGAFQFLTDDLQTPHKNLLTQGYSCCHFWSNFEIGNLDFFRGEAYTKYTEYLESTGKFYYERWGDAPVHSIALALFADKKDIHWFRDLGYHHEPYYYCPSNPRTKGCRAGVFGPNPENNCLEQWIEYEIENPQAIY